MTTSMANQTQLFEQLRALTRNWNTYDDIPESQQKECIQIGKRLHALGGEGLMRDAYYDAKAANVAVTVIQAYWDGIGEWRW